MADAGAMGSFVNSITANTRTALQAMASDTRRLIYQQNEDVIDGYRWLATLDRRTCLVCGANDGKEVRYLNDFKEQVPLHYNCRCIIVPIIKGFEELKDDSRVNSKEGYSYKRKRYALYSYSIV